MFILFPCNDLIQQCLVKRDFFQIFTISFFLCILSISNVNADEQNILHVNFEGHQPGDYAENLIHKDWQNLKWTGLYDRGSIIEDTHDEHGNVLKIEYPKGSVGPGEGGGQFLVSIPESKEYWLTYDLKFNEAFDFKMGGKLPGLTSGGGKYTGGNIPVNGDGWSARYMWKGGGKAVVYFYYVDMPGKWGESLRLESVTFQPGQWHRLTQHIKVNQPGESDGLLEVWFDGKKVLSKNNIRFRVGEKGLIDSLYFSTFHGGNTDDWAPRVDCYALFDNFIISKNKPNYLSSSNLSNSEKMMHK